MTASGTSSPAGTLLPSARARALMIDIFARLAVPADECEILATTLMEASLSGYDSHGIMRVPKYVDGIAAGTMIPGAEFRIVRQTAASALVDAGFGLGPVTATRAMRLAGEMARQEGIGCVSTCNSNDVARLGSYVLEPAAAGQLALLMVNDAGGGPSVVPWGGVQPFMSTNPIAAGIPRGGAEEPIVIDVSTGTVAFGKLRMAANQGEAVPEGWLVDTQGQPTTDPNTFFADPQASALLPLGGLQTGYKGYALGMLVDILAGALGGAGCSTGGEIGREGNGIFLMVVDPARFGSPEAFTAAVDGLVAGIKGSRRAPGVDEITVPGERAARERAARERDGIPVDGPTRARLRQIAADNGLSGDYPML